MTEDLQHIYRRAQPWRATGPNIKYGITFSHIIWYRDRIQL